MRAKSVNFERGKDPKDAMGIGNREERDIKKIDNFVKNFGFERVLKNTAHEGHLTWIAEWENQKKDVFVMWYYQPEQDRYFFYVEGWGISEKDGHWYKDREAEGSLDDLFYPGVFENIIAGEPMYWKIIKESVNFERGQDPKAAMGIGKAGEDNYFRDNLVGFPYESIIERDGAWPWGDGNRILAKAAEMLEIPEKDVQVAVEYKNEPLTTSRIEEYIEDHEWIYDMDDVAGEFELIKVGSGEIYVFEQGEQEDPYMILGSPF